MVGPSTECQIRLYRDSLTTPWGFRLQGGKDFKAPLSVQRVFVGSPADGELQRGDAIVAINNYDATHLSHKQAMDVIKESGGALSLRLRRSLVAPQPAPAAPVAAFTGLQMESPQYFRSRPMVVPGTKPLQPSAGSAAPQFGVDYSKGYLPPPNILPAPRSVGKESAMLNRVQQSLNNALWPQSAEDEEYQARSVNELKNVFVVKEPATRPLARPQPQRTTNQQPQRIVHQQPQRVVNQQPQRTVNTHPAWAKPDPYTSPEAPSEPGWTSKWTAAKAPVQNSSPTKRPAHQPRPAPVNLPQPVPPAHVKSDRPAWQGSLKSSGGPKPWEMGQQLEDGGVLPVHQPKVQHYHQGPGGDITYQQHSDGDPTSETAQVKHLQYNTPIGLYSNANVQEVLEGQTHGKPGHGTMQVAPTGPGGKKLFDPKSSDVLRMIQEEESHRKAAGQQSARYTGPDQNLQMHYEGFVDPNRQGPAMERLSHKYPGQAPASRVQPAPSSTRQAVPEALPNEYGVSDF